MKFKYKIEEITRSLTLDDLMGVYRLITSQIAPEYWSMTDIENFINRTVPTLEPTEKQKIERLILDCARFNSIGF